MTDPQQPVTKESPSEGTRRNALLGVLVATVLGAVVFLVPPAIQALQRYEPAVSTSSTGTALVPAGQRRVTVALAQGVTDETVVRAEVARRAGDLVSARVIGPSEAAPQFTVALGRAAPAGGAAVQWRAAGLSPDDSAAGGWSTEWVVVLALMALSLLAALAAFTMAVKRRQAGADGAVDVGPELASFLKVAALLMVAALALIAVMLATDEKSLTGLFALLGTIAGYLAGNRSATTGSAPRRRGGAAGRVKKGGPVAGGNGGEKGDVGARAQDDDQREPRTDDLVFEMTQPYETRSLL